MSHTLLYTDISGIHGMGQCNHVLACALVEAGYKTTFIQPIVDDDLVTQQEAIGISHGWLEPDDIFNLSEPARSLTDKDEPRRLLAAAMPDLILFNDSCPFSNLKAKQVAIELNISYLIIVQSVQPQWAQDYAEWLPELPEIYSSAQAVISVSQPNLDLLNGIFGLPLNRGAVIYNGRPLEFFKHPDQTVRQQMRATLNIPHDAVVCLTVARFDLSKGYQHQIDAIVELRKSSIWENLHFIWVGQGLMEKEFANIIKLLRVDDRIHILNTCQDIPALMDSSDIFILPSQSGGMPLAIMEAMAKGLPIIATVVGGTSELVNESGFLLPNPTSTPIKLTLSKAIFWLADSSEVRAEMGTSARKRADQYFRNDTMVSNYLVLISALLARQKRLEIAYG
ncbi:MAG: glycosyltransferase involved in cell wall biosynthesis [Cellvibrionaceae bacterium]|jgi:glycosyltransferase involved in cell wall biosynthesis